MNPVPLNEIAGLADDQVVMAVRGRVKKAFDVRTGMTGKGNPWSNQGFILTDGTTEVGCSLWDVDSPENRVSEGMDVWFAAKKNGKGQWDGIKKETYKEEPKLSIRAERVQWINAQNAPPIPSPHQNAPSGPVNAPVARPIFPSDVLTPSEHVGRAAALWLLCYDEVTAVIQPRCSDMTPDLKQSVIASLFIEASRAGCVSQMHAQFQPPKFSRETPIPTDYKRENDDDIPF